MISIIIPAHNEEKTIHKCIHTLLSDVDIQAEIIVVCNGCTDNTKGVLEAFRHAITILDTPVPSKALALNMGDKNASHFPRFYLDADVLISPAAIKAIMDDMETDEAIYAASPYPRFDLSKSTWFVKAFYKIWQNNVFFLDDNRIGGSGVYILSKEGHKKLGKIPNVINDDGYIDVFFTNENKRRIKDCFSLVKAPSTIIDVIKIKARGRIGLYQLNRKYPSLKQSKIESHQKFILRMITMPNTWLELLVYLLSNLAIRVYASYLLSNSDNPYQWLRDESSRQNQ